jgi:hypothetical protein
MLSSQYKINLYQNLGNERLCLDTLHDYKVGRYGRRLGYAHGSMLRRRMTLHKQSWTTSMRESV